jgi:hypothetical protein
MLLLVGSVVLGTLAIERTELATLRASTARDQHDYGDDVR